MRIAQWKVGTRLAAGFGLLLLVMAALAGAGLASLAQVGAMNARLVQRDWAKADAAATVSLLTRDNARYTLQLFIATPDEEAAILQRIDANKERIGAALERLDRLVYLEDGRRMLTGIREARARYVRSFTAVSAMLAHGERELAAARMRRETLALLDALQAQVRDFADLQRRAAQQGGVDVRASIDRARVALLAGTAIGLLLGVAAAWLIVRSLTGQLGGEPAYASAVACRVAEGDLSTPVPRRAGDQVSLMHSLATMRDRLAQLVGGVREGTISIASAAEQIAAGNADLSSRTEAQASALEETAAALEQLAATVTSNAEYAQTVNALVRTAEQEAGTGGEVVRRMADSMERIDASSRAIADILGIIDGIAFQTNILALNAAVEAARAGEQGRAFGIVAAEVRQLAQRSAGAARDIRRLVAASMEQVAEGAQLAVRADETMHGIVASICRVSGLVNEIAHASGEQAAGIAQVTQAVTQMDEMTQQNAALVEEAAAAAEALRTQAAGLAQDAAVFRLANDEQRLAIHSTIHSLPSNRG